MRRRYAYPALGCTPAPKNAAAPFHQSDAKSGIALGAAMFLRPRPRRRRVRPLCPIVWPRATEKSRRPAPPISRGACRRGGYELASQCARRLKGRQNARAALAHTPVPDGAKWVKSFVYTFTVRERVSDSERGDKEARIKHTTRPSNGKVLAMPASAAPLAGRASAAGGVRWAEIYGLRAGNCNGSLARVTPRRSPGLFDASYMRWHRAALP